jgi:hypothetical protein
MKREVRNGLLLLLWFAPLATAVEPVRLAAKPREFTVVPGEPVRVQLTVRADSAERVRIHVPADPLLVLRAVEKRPVRLDQEGALIHTRVVIWQPLEPGTVTMHAIWAETGGRKLTFPEITISVLDPGP